MPVLVGLGLFALLLPALADTVWTGSTGDWFTQSNWLNETQPNALESAVIQNHGIVQISGGQSGAAHSLFMGSAIGGATLEITNGYLGLANDLILSTVPGAWSASVSVSGSNASMYAGGQVRIGDYAASSLTVSHGGTFTSSMPNAVVLGLHSSGSGTINLQGTEGARGMLKATNIAVGNGTGALNFNGGILQAAANHSNFLAGFADGSIVIGNQGGTIDTNGYDIGISSSMDIIGHLTKKGAGTLTLSGNYTGISDPTYLFNFQYSPSGFESPEELSLSLAANYLILLDTVFQLFFNGAMPSLSPPDLGLTIKEGSLVLQRADLNLIQQAGSPHLSTSLYVGREAGDNARLVIADYSSAITGTSYVGAVEGTTGRVSVEQAVWQTLGIYLGSNGTGILEIGSKGLVMAGEIHAGADSSVGSPGTAEILVDGGVLSTIGKINITGDSDEKLTIKNGGLVSADYLLVTSREDQPGAPRILVDGGTLRVRTGLLLGAGELTITNGGRFTATGGDTKIGMISGTLNVDGGGTYEQAFDLLVADFSIDDPSPNSGVVNILNGLVKIDGATFLGAGDFTTIDGGHFQGVGHMLLAGTSAGRGILQTTFIQEGSVDLMGVGFVPGGVGQLTFDGGVLRAGANSLDFIKDFESGDVIIEDGGAFIDSNGFAITITTDLSGDGALIKTGAGILTLTGNNSYAGGTIIQAGTLRLAHATALGAAPSPLVIEGGTLDVFGRSVTVGTLSGIAGGVITNGILGDSILTIEQTSSGIFGGAIKDGAGQIAVTKTGTGTLRVTGSNSYTGATLLSQGVTEISGGGVLGSGTVTIAAGTLAQPGATLSFVDIASAGTRTYLNEGATENNAFGGSTVFYDTSSAGSARLVANAGANGGRGGIISFTGSSNGGTAQVELTGNGRLTIAAHNPGTVSIGSLLGDGDVTLGANHLAIGTNNLSTTFSGSILNAGSISKVGTGTLTITGVNAHTGGTRVEKGALRLSGLGTLGSGTTTVASGTSFAQIESMLFFNDTANAGSGAYVIEGATVPGAYGGLMGFYDNTSAGSARIIALGGSNTGGGGIIAFVNNSDGGTSEIEVQGNGRLTIAAHAAGTVSIGSLAGNGLVTLGANNLTIGTNNRNTAFAGSISDTGSITKVGTGTLTVTGANTYSGGIQLSKGGIAVSGQGMLGSGTTTIASGTTAQIEAALLFRDFADAGSGTYVNNGAAVLGASGGLTGFYDNTTAGSAKLVALGGSNGGGGGLIGFAGNSDGGTSQVDVRGNGRLTIATHNAGSVGIGSLAGDGLVTLGANTLSIGSNNLSTTFAGSISDGGSITKVGTGTLSLTGISTYSGGTEILAGTLIIAGVGPGSSVLGTGEVLVGEAGTLGGIGTVLGDTRVAGILSPGNSPGAIHFAGALTLDSTAVLRMELAELEGDFLSVGGLLTYDGILALTLSEGYRPGISEEFDLFDAAFVASGSEFRAITFNVAGYAGEMNYGTGVLTITAVPEPSTLALAGVALLALCGSRRRAHRH